MALLDLKAAQSSAITKMLAFNADAAAASGACPEWKVLVYDSAGSEVIAPLLSVGELRKLGVTLHLRLDQPREPISDVAAVYFVRPTEANVRRIADDLKRRLYRSFHLNFAHKTPRELVELLARESVQAGAAPLVASVFDQHLDFVTLEPTLFSLQRRGCSYVEYNDPSAGEAQIVAAMGQIAHGIFAALVALGGVPVIRAPRGGAAEMVARAVHELVAQAFHAGGVFPPAPSGGRCSS